MALPIQPGRIAPPKKLRELASITKPIKKAMRQGLRENNASTGGSKIKKFAKGYALTAGLSVANPLAGGVFMLGKLRTHHIEKRDAQNMKEFKKKVQMGGSPGIPKTKKRISFLGQIALIGFSALVDLAEIGCNIFFGSGVAINRIIDIAYAIILLIYCIYKGLTIRDDFNVYGSLMGAFGLEMVPLVDTLPFFFGDAWYITNAIKVKDRARQAKLNAEAANIIEEERVRKEMENFERQQRRQTEEDEEEEEAEAEQEEAENNEQDEGSTEGDQEKLEEGRMKFRSTQPVQNKSFDTPAGTAGRIAPKATVPAAPPIIPPSIPPIVP